MRKLMLLGGVAALVVAVPAIADTKFGQTTQTVQSKVTPSKAGTVAAPKGAQLYVRTATKNDDGSQPPVVSKAVITFPKEFEFNGKAFPFCTKGQLNDQGMLTSCQSKGAQVGTGTSQGQLGTTKVPFTIVAINGPGGNKIELFIKGAPVNKALEGTLSGGKGKVKKLTVPIPPEIQQAVPGTFASIADFTTTVKKSIKKAGKTVNYFETTGCPANKKWTVSGEFTVNSAAPSSAGAPAKLTDKIDVPCTK
jgi:hypothetical protein